jgi:hypothetical protein
MGGPKSLDCQSCSRPTDPETGLCNLHGSSWSPPTSSPPPHSSGPPVSSARPADGTSRTLVGAVALDRDGLRQRVFAPEMVCRRSEAAQIVNYLLGDQALLEVTGEPGAGKSVVLNSLAATAESLDFRVLRMAPDHRLATRPWYPARRLIGQVLGCGPKPATKRSLLEATESFQLSTDQLQGLTALFGLASAGAPEQGVELARAIRRGAAAVLAALQDGASGTCLIADETLTYDRATQSLLRALPQLLGRRLTKLAVSSDGGFFPDRNHRVNLRPGGLDLAGITTLLAQAGIPGDRTALAQAIGDASGGNALGVTQAICAIGEGGQGSTLLGDPLAWRIGQLTEDASRVLQEVSALGGEVPLELLTDLDDGQGVNGAVELLIERGLLAVGPDQALAPAHSALAATALQTMPAAQRSELHARILKVMERRGASVFVLAHHAFEAELERLAEDALDLLVTAGDEACRWADVETAALAHYRRAVHTARWRLLMSEEDERYLELSLRLGRTLAAAGHRRAAEVVFREVAGAAGRYPNLAGLARKALDELPPR